MHIFVTGVSGFIGGSVAQCLVERGVRVTGLTRSGDKVAALKERGIEAIVGSLDDADV